MKAFLLDAKRQEITNIHLDNFYEDAKMILKTPSFSLVTLWDDLIVLYLADCMENIDLPGIIVIAEELYLPGRAFIVYGDEKHFFDVKESIEDV